MLLTTSLAITALPAAATIFYVGEPPAERQLERVRRQYALAFDPAALLSRCASCNGRVGTKVSAEALLEGGAFFAQVPAHVRESETEIWACDDCGKAYWVGPKSRRAVELAARLCGGGEGGGGSVFGTPLEGETSESSQLAAQIADVLACAGMLGSGGRGRRVRGQGEGPAAADVAPLLAPEC